MKLRPLIIFIFLLIVTASCGALPPPQQPKSYEELTALNHRANQAYQQREYSKALNLYTQALGLSRSLDNTPSAAVNLINMAVVYRKLKDREKADRALNEALSLEGLPSYLLSEAQFQKALLYLDTGRLTEAQLWAEKSLATCKSSQGCESSLAARWNLLGRIALLAGNSEDALRYASLGYEASKKHENQAEEANSYRLMGEIKVKAKEFISAREYYQKALAVDKAQGQSHKILLDLKGLAEVYAEEGNAQEAARYYKRAYEVAKNAGEAEEAEKFLQKLELIRRR